MAGRAIEKSQSGRAPIRSERVDGSAHLFINQTRKGRPPRDFLGLKFAHPPEGKRKKKKDPPSKTEGGAPFVLVRSCPDEEL
jgi:hypothetical protein